MLIVLDRDGVYALVSLSITCLPGSYASIDVWTTAFRGPCISHMLPGAEHFFTSHSNWTRRRLCNQVVLILILCICPMLIALPLPDADLLFLTVRGIGRRIWMGLRVEWMWMNVGFFTTYNTSLIFFLFFTILSFTFRHHVSELDWNIVHC